MKLEIKELSKTYAGHIALDAVDLHIPDCNTLTILGPSGSGKSTLLSVIAGLEIPDSGKIRVDGQEVPLDESKLIHYRRGVGVVFQSLNLFPHLTVLQNIELPLHRVHGLKWEEAAERAMEFLKRFRLEEHAFKKPSQLSGGQRQRVAIVRAAAIKARLLLLDEPTSALDPFMTSEVLDLILELREEGCGIILVSHHMGFVKRISDWIVFLDLGKVVEIAPATQFFVAPKTEQAQRFLEKILKY
jgi:polar amino acid transport system ATP-binding protein